MSNTNEGQGYNLDAVLARGANLRHHFNKIREDRECHRRAVEDAAQRILTLERELREANNVIEQLDAQVKVESEGFKLAHAELEKSQAEAAKMRGALEKIKNEGKVCGDYEMCHHASCGSSYNSWSYADEALSESESAGEES